MSSAASGGGPKWSWNTLRVQSEQLPFVIAVFSGGALLVLLVLAIILWRCCVAPHRNKDYRVKMHDTPTLATRTVVPVLPSHSAVYLDPKSGEWSVSSRVVGCWRASTGSSRHWFYNNSMLNPAALDSKCIVPRSVSVPAPRSLPLIHGQSGSSLSSPAASTPSSRRQVVGGPSSLPQISEFYPNAGFCASSSVLQESLSELYCCDNNGRRGGLTKTQSLPACVRSKSKLSSSGDDSSDLYAKVNFSKKRKNRMRNDEAAIIALSKSGSQFLDKDTDILVDNEAIVVYDERTAL